jgi:hypothetical protein
MRAVIRFTVSTMLAASPTLGAVAPGHVPFRSSLTATVIIPSGTGQSKTRTGTPAALGCRDVILRWAELPGSKRYDVYVSARVDGPWSQLPPANVCGEVRRPSVNGIIDVEPTSGAPSVVHHLYYKVIALAGTAAGSSALDVTDPVSVELP